MEPIIIVNESFEKPRTGYDPISSSCMHWHSDRLLTRDHFFTLPSKFYDHAFKLICSSLLHIMIIIKIMLVVPAGSQKYKRMVGFLLLTLA